MSRRTRITCVVICIVLVGVDDAFDASQAQSRQVFRGRVALVPVDVRIVDRDGNPVVDLSRDDFTIFEDDVPQSIAHFETLDRTSDVSQGSPDVSIAGTTINARPFRNFLFVLGRGRLQGPSKGFDAVLEFIRSQAQPEDRLGVVAYDRISELTTDRDAVIRLIARYRERHEQIEALLDHWFRDLTAAYGSADPPSGIQTRIDRLFAIPGLPKLRSLMVRPPEDIVVTPREREYMLGALREGEEGSTRGFIYNAAARQDLEKLHAAIEYLRYLTGEKHAILISSEGLIGLPSTVTQRLARMASDARVTISVIHTGGLATSWTRVGRSVRFEGPSWRQLDANADSKALATDTGGIASIYTYADRTLGRIERATRFQYLLGYYPQRESDKGFRRIRVEVRRRGVSVIHRHGYYARVDQRSYDRREYVANARIAAGGAYSVLVKDIPVQLAATVEDAGDLGWALNAEIRIPPAAVVFKESDGRRVTSIDVAVFVGDAGRRTVGELHRRVDLKLVQASYDQLLREGIAFSGRIPTTAQPRYAKAVVYDYHADRLGSALMEIR